MVMPKPTNEATECDYCAEWIQAGDPHVIIGEREEPWHVSCAAALGIQVESINLTDTLM